MIILARTDTDVGKRRVDMKSKKLSLVIGAILVGGAIFGYHQTGNADGLSKLAKMILEVPKHAKRIKALETKVKLLEEKISVMESRL